MKWLCRKLNSFSQAQFDNAYENLTDSRKARIDRLHHQEDRLRSLAGDILVQELAAEFGVSKAAVQVLPSGQPILATCNLHISITHCQDQIACAMDTAPVGIDMEALRPFRPGVLRHVCNDRETEYVLGGLVVSEEEITDVNCIERFFEVWTAKEAWFKKIGTGITNLPKADVLPMKRQIFRIDDFIIQIV